MSTSTTHPIATFEWLFLRLCNAINPTEKSKHPLRKENHLIGEGDFR